MINPINKEMLVNKDYQLGAGMSGQQQNSSTLR
jgi:hypothetical protein